MEQKQFRGRKFAGDIYCRRYGSNDTWQKMGNATSLTTSREIETDELISTGKHDYGQAIESETKPGVTSLAIEFNTYDRNSLTRALMGTEVDLDTTVQTISEHEITVALGGWLDLPHKDIDLSTVEIVDDASTPIDVSTYEVNSSFGMLMFNDTSSLSDGETIKVSYSTKGRAGYQIEAYTVQSLSLELRLDGVDRITNKEGLAEFFHTELSSGGDLDWMSDDWWSSGIEGTVIKEAGKPILLFTEYNE